MGATLLHRLRAGGAVGSQAPSRRCTPASLPHDRGRCVTTAVKICCIASLAEAQAALAAGASAIGLVSAMPSGPGPIPESRIAEIVAALPPQTDTFLLTALLQADALAEQHARCRSRTLQLVDRMAEGEGPRLRRRLPAVRLVQVVHVEDASAFDEAMAAAEWADALLLDSGRRGGAVLQLGGTGRTHDWAISARIRQAASCPVWLAGGLDAGNAARAMAAVRPHGLDLCNGVRREGALDGRRLADFMHAVRTADATP